MRSILLLTNGLLVIERRIRRRQCGQSGFERNLETQPGT